MTSTKPARRMRPALALAALAAAAIGVALFTPEAVDNTGGDLSSYSAAPGGSRIVFELSRRLGWTVQRRVAPVDATVDSTSVLAIIGPRGGIGAQEAHRVLTNVRAGGGLVLAIDSKNPITDSLGIALRRSGPWLRPSIDPDCREIERPAALTLPPVVQEIVWRRPPPGTVTELAATDERLGPRLLVGIGVRVGRGRVVLVSGPDLFRNDVVRNCPWRADIVVVRALEFVRPAAGRPTLIFDEYHHGFGTHPGSTRAVTLYLARTSSGHFLLQALIAGLVLLLAKAPRPIVPHEPPRVARRSPLEHADALGQAYADVHATRTATMHLVAGLRRRSGRMVGVGSVADDAFLEAVAQRHPDLRDSVDTIRRALLEPLEPRDLSAVGDALRTIEQRLTATLSSSSRT
jgi:Domain of unknown function (DUF4350)